MNPSISKEMKRYNHLLGEIDAAYHEIALRLGLSDSVMRIFYTICDNGESCPLQEICRRSGVSKQTINSAIRKLEQEGAVYLEPIGAKSKNVCLTAAGKELAKRTAVRIIEIENEIFSSWPKEDRDKYLMLTELFLNSLREKTACLPKKAAGAKDDISRKGIRSANFHKEG